MSYVVVIRNFAALSDLEKNLATFLSKKEVEGFELVSMSREGLQHQFVFRDRDEVPLESYLRRVVDDLWGCIGKTEITHLDPETVKACHENHELLWHT